MTNEEMNSIVLPERRSPVQRSTSGKWFLSLGVFLLGVTSVLVALIIVPGVRSNGEATTATRDELACRAVSQVNLETARAELQRGQARLAAAQGIYLVASEDVLRAILSGAPSSSADAAVVAARKRFEQITDEVEALDTPLAAAISARDAAVLTCDSHSIGANPP